jgi:hypothetical protein
MSKKIATNLDLQQNQLLQARLENLSAAPSTPAAGQVWFDTTNQCFMVRTSTTSVDLRDRSVHTGTQLANTISNFDTQVRTSRLDQMAVPTAAVNVNSQKITSLANGSASNDAVNYSQLQGAIAQITTTRLDQMAAPTSALNLNSQKITNLADGTNASDGATYGQLMALVNGMDWKQSVRAATTASITLSGLQTIDGVTLSAGQRVLVRAQADGSQNGIWLAQSGAWTRPNDAVQGTLTADAAVFVEEGTTYQDTQWRLTTNDAITVGTTLLAWSQIGAGSSYTNGAGLNLAGNSFSIDTSVVVRKFAQTIGDGSSLSIAVTHGLGTLDVTVAVFQVSDGAEIICDIVRTSSNVVTVGFAVAPTASQFRVVIHG